jgi:hypothetical protein
MNTQPELQVVTPANPFAEVTAGESKEFPAKVILYGVPKIGKSRFCSDADDAFFINIENGLDYIGKKVRSTPKLDNFEDVMAWLVHILDSDTFKAGTIVVDSLDWMETLAQQKLVKQEKAKSIVDPAIKAFAYYKGVEMAASDTMRLFTALDMIYKKKGIKSIVIAHSQIKNIDLPNQDPYSRHDMKLSKYLAAKAMEWGDLVLFADYSFHVTKEGKTSEPKPCLFAGGNASFVGGGRMKLDKELPLDYNALKQHITNKGVK